MFRNPLEQPNGLQKVYLGEFEQDPSGDFIIDVVDKVNHNVDLLDAKLGEQAVLQQQVDSLALKGLFYGYINGGVCGAPRPAPERSALSVSKMFVTKRQMPNEVDLQDGEDIVYFPVSQEGYTDY